MGKSEAQRQREREAAAAPGPEGAGPDQPPDQPVGAAPPGVDPDRDPDTGGLTAEARQRELEHPDRPSDAEADAWRPSGPVATVDQALDAVGTHRPGAIPVASLSQQEVEQLPAQVGGGTRVAQSVSGTPGGPTHTAVGTPPSQAYPSLPRIGDGTARGETQPAIPPPGELERAIDPGTLDRLQRRNEGPGAEKATSAVHENGVISVRYADGRVLRINTMQVESIEDDRETIKITLATGKAYDFSGEDAGVVRNALPR